jgi:hypothetical protein
MKQIKKVEKEMEEIVKELKEKHGKVIGVTLPEGTLAFRKMNSGEYIYMQSRMGEAATNKNGTELTSAMKDSVSQCCVHGDFSLVENHYPAVIPKIFNKLMEASGSEIEVDFLD